MRKVFYQFIVFLSKTFGHKQSDLLDNEYAIMQQLFNGSHTKLTSQQSIELKERIDKRFDEQIKERYFEAHQEKLVIEKEIEFIEQYNVRKKTNIETNS